MRPANQMSTIRRCDHLKKMDLLGVNNLEYALKQRRLCLKHARLFYAFGLNLLYCYMIYMIVLDYRKYEVITKIRVFNEKPTLYPTITICNRNKFVTGRSHAFLHKYKYHINPLLTAHVASAASNRSPFEFVGNDSRNSNEFVFLNLIEASHDAKNPEFNDSVKQEFGLLIREMLIECYFDEKECNESRFVWHYDFIHGNCYKFNSGYDQAGKRVPLLRVQKPGRMSGLLLHLFTGRPQEKFLSEYTAGVSIYVGNASIKPIMNRGLSAPPGALTSISIKRVFTRRLPAPYSDCDEPPPSSSPVHSQLSGANYTYRQKDCFELCMQRAHVAACGCYDLKHVEIERASPCRNATQRDCLTRHAALVGSSGKSGSVAQLDRLCSPHCPRECNEAHYEFSSSMALFPARAYIARLRQHALVRRHFTDESQMSDAALRECLLALDINYGELEYTLISEKASKTLFDLLGSIGGTMGLILGASLLNLIDVFEVARRFVQRRRRQLMRRRARRQWSPSFESLVVIRL